MDASSSTPPIVMGDTFLTLFLSFLTYLVIILGGVYIVWLFPVVRNGSTNPNADVFIRWSTTAASFVHATLMTSVGMLVVLFEDWQTKSIVEGKSPLVPTFVAWEIGHIMQQSMFKSYLMIENNRFQDVTPLLQYGIVMVVLLCRSWLGIGDFFVGLFFVSHFSSAFWDLRMLLAKGGKEQTTLYRFVSIMCPFSFILCRFMPILYLVLKERNALGEPERPDELPIKLLALITVSTVYNVMAFVRIVQTKCIRKTFKLS